MTQATAEPAPETAGLEHSDPATNARLRKAAFHATRLYPGPVGELIADELLAVEAWGYRIAATSRAHRLTEHVLAQLDAEKR